MRKIIFSILVCAIFYSCSNQSNNYKKVRKESISDVIEVALTLTGENQVHLFHEYDNSRFEELVMMMYTNSTDIGYDINDSIKVVIKTKRNAVLESEISQIQVFDIEIIEDSTIIRPAVIVFSEPVFFTENIFCFCWSIKDINKNLYNEYSVIIKMNNSKGSIAAFYDRNKNIHFRPMKE